MWGAFTEPGEEPQLRRRQIDLRPARKPFVALPALVVVGKAAERALDLVQPVVLARAGELMPESGTRAVARSGTSRRNQVSRNANAEIAAAMRKSGSIDSVTAERYAWRNAGGSRSSAAGVIRLGIAAPGGSFCAR